MNMAQHLDVFLPQAEPPPPFARQFLESRRRFGQRLLRNPDRRTQQVRYRHAQARSQFSQHLARRVYPRFTLDLMQVGNRNARDLGQLGPPKSFALAQRLPAALEAPLFRPPRYNPIG